MSHFGARQQLRKLVQRFATTLPALRQRRISLHSIRHSTAMGLLQSGVTTEVIALWLGHESPNTTHQYIEANLTMKKKALESVVPPKSKSIHFDPEEKLLRFLEQL